MLLYACMHVLIEMGRNAIFFFLSISRLIYVLVSHLGSEVDDRLFDLFFPLHYISFFGYTIELCCAFGC